jgi:serine/threonine protein kinase
MPLSAVQCKALLRFEEEFWRQLETPDIERAASEAAAEEREELYGRLVELSQALSAARQSMIDEFSGKSAGWSGAAREAFFARHAQPATAIPREMAERDPKLRTQLVGASRARRDGVARTLIRGQLEAWLKSRGEVPAPEEFRKLFAGLLSPAQLDALLYAEVSRELKFNLWRYAPLKSIAAGGTAELFEVMDNELRRLVAKKQLRQDRAATGGRQILHEAFLLARLSHPGIPVVLGTGRDGACPFFAMELLPRATLLSEIERVHRPGTVRRFDRTEPAVVRLVRCLVSACNVVGFAHAKEVVHRDLKPSNIIFAEFEQTYVIDWGMAWQLGEPDLYEDRAGFGTVDYMAPERADWSIEPEPAGTPPEDPRTRFDAAVAADVYSLGATLYHVLCGKPLFATLGEGRIRRGLKRALRRLTDPAERGLVERALADRTKRSWIAAGLAGQRDQTQQKRSRLLKCILLRVISVPGPRPRDGLPLDAELAAICKKAMHRDPRKRYQSAGELADRLERWLVDAPDADFARWPFRHPLVWARRQHGLRSFARRAVGALALAALAAALFMLPKPQGNGPFGRAWRDAQRACAEFVSRLNAAFTQQPMAPDGGAVRPPPHEGRGPL